MQDSGPSAVIATAVDEARRRHGDVVMMWGAGVVFLSAHAEAAARELHRRLGDRVDIVLGARRYPTGSWWPEEPGAEVPIPYDPLADTLDFPEWIGVEVDFQGSVTKGPDRFVRATVSNRGSDEIVVVSGGPPSYLDGYLVAPGDSVALSAPGGARHQMAVPITVPPGQSVELQAVFGVGATWHGTGYTVPPGEYELKLVVPVAHAAYSSGSGAPVRYRTDGTPVTVQLG